MSPFLYGTLAVVASAPVFLGMNFHEFFFLEIRLLIFNIFNIFFVKLILFCFVIFF